MSETTNDITVRDNPERHRFEAIVGEHVAVAEYVIGPTLMRLTHTIVPEALAGRGIGGKLAEAALGAARERGLKVIPLCTFMASYIRKHPEYRDLVPADQQEKFGL